ncbi:SDR family NAD(P)-dependent oxidoreductase [Streptomyces gilvus]|uniref:SDR family NAD(P)-dependent oxidoreductase n=1 Tax=Streptomyces gilvus TaxID=2920937 RepID=UPI001F0ED7D5|nr:SDR family oxidoreductase [Streptomyces sp. CME 23]MCH5677591.1 SDR family oxidoreductase [Streptomyces sp. CME 23]
MGYLEELAGLRGRHAVVIGGAGGLGALSSRALVRAGMRVTVLDRDAAAADALREELGGALATVVGDARDDACLDEVADVAGPRVAVLVNVVGGTFWSELDKLSDNAIDSLVGLNFLAPVRAVRRLLPALRTAGAEGAGAAIVNVTSIEAHRGAPAISVYAAMKAALTSMTASLAVELAPSGIRVNTIAPDVVETPALDRILGHDTASEETKRARYSATIPLGRPGSPEDWAGALLFLASGLSRYVTGQSLRVDGGSSAAPGFTHWTGDGWFPFLPLTAAENMSKFDELRGAADR